MLMGCIQEHPRTLDPDQQPDKSVLDSGHASPTGPFQNPELSGVERSTENTKGQDKGLGGTSMRAATSVHPQPSNVRIRVLLSKPGYCGIFQHRTTHITRSQLTVTHCTSEQTFHHGKPRTVLPGWKAIVSYTCFLCTIQLPDDSSRFARPHTERKAFMHTVYSPG